MGTSNSKTQQESEQPKQPKQPKQPEQPEQPKHSKQPKQPKQPEQPKHSKQPKQPKQPEQPEQSKQPEEIFMEEPWRSFEAGGDWTTEYRDRLVDNIKSLKHLEEVESARIAIFGIIGSGKSSFLNSIACIENGRISAFVNIGSAKDSLTREFAQYVPTTLGNNFILLDTMGIEAVDGIDMNEARNAIVGNLDIGYKFSTNQPFTTKPLNQKNVAHCIVIVMDSNLIDTESITDLHLKEIEKLQIHARNEDVRTVLLLTKIDRACPELNKDLKKVFLSRRMKEIAMSAKDKLRIPMMQVYPVRNYSEEMELNLDMDILLLLALRQMVRFANDRITHVANQKVGKTSPSESKS